MTLNLVNHFESGQLFQGAWRWIIDKSGQA